MEPQNAFRRYLESAGVIDALTKGRCVRAPPQATARTERQPLLQCPPAAPDARLTWLQCWCRCTRSLTSLSRQSSEGRTRSTAACALPAAARC